MKARAKIKECIKREKGEDDGPITSAEWEIHNDKQKNINGPPTVAGFIEEYLAEVRGEWKHLNLHTGQFN